MAGGRPTKYDDDILVKAREYVDSFVNVKKDADEVIPTIAGLSIVLKIDRTTVYDWADQDDKKEFSNIVRELMAKQELTLMNKGLSGAFNPNITKLALTKHGYRDKADLTTDDKPINNLDDTARAAKLTGLLEKVEARLDGSGED